MSARYGPARGLDAAVLQLGFLADEATRDFLHCGRWKVTSDVQLATAAGSPVDGGGGHGSENINLARKAMADWRRAYT